MNALSNLALGMQLFATLGLGLGIILGLNLSFFTWLGVGSAMISCFQVRLLDTLLQIVIRTHILTSHSVAFSSHETSIRISNVSAPTNALCTPPFDLKPFIFEGIYQTSAVRYRHWVRLLDIILQKEVFWLTTQATTFAFHETIDYRSLLGAE